MKEVKNNVMTMIIEITLGYFDNLSYLNTNSRCRYDMYQVQLSVFSIHHSLGIQYHRCQISQNLTEPSNLLE